MRVSASHDSWRVLRFVLHLIVTLLLTAVTISVNIAFADLSRSFGRSLVATFFPEDYVNVNQAFVEDFSYYIFTIPDAEDDVQRLLQTYNELPDISVSPIEHTSKGPVAEIVDTRGRKKRYHPSADGSSWLSDDGTIAQARDFLSKLEIATFRFHLKSRPQTAKSTCYFWEADFIYDLSARAQFTVTCSYRATSVCDDHGKADIYSAIIVLTSLAVAFSGLYEVFLLRFAWILYPHWDMWNIVSQVGANCTLLFGLCSLLSGAYVETKFWLKLLLGSACFIQYLSLVQFFEREPRYNVLVLTLKRGIPRVGRFLLGTSPLFFGFMLLGMILFGDLCEDFGDLSRTAATLFAVVNGDVILDVSPFSCKVQ